MPTPASRNAACPCGSGKRYKHCCGAGDAGPPGPAVETAPDALFGRAYRAHQSGRLEQAETLYREHLEQRPDDPHGLHYLGVCRYQRGAFPEAERFIRAALHLDVAEPMAYNNLGLVLKELGRDAEAMTCYETALQQDPGNANARSNLGLLLVHLGRVDEARAAFEAAIAVQPGNAIAQQNLGKLLSGLQRYDEALVCCDAAIRLAPSMWEAYSTRGYALLALRRHDEAMPLFDAAIRLNPRAAEAYGGLASALLLARRYPEALAAAEQAIAVEPDSVDAYLTCAQILIGWEKYATAIERIDQIQPRDDSGAMGYVLKARCLLELHRLDEAMTACEQALIRQADLAYAHALRGAVHAQQQDYETAFASLDAALRLEPGLSYTYQIRARVLHDQMRIEEAVACCDQGLAHNPEDPHLCIEKGFMLLQLGRLSEGWPLYEIRQVLKPNPPPPFATQAPWHGETIDGNLLVWAEQGVGDQIMFALLLPELLSRAAKVGAAVDVRLLPLLRRSLPEIEWLPLVADAPVADYVAQISLASLGRLLRSDIGDFARGRGRRLQADAARSTRLRAALQAGGKRLCGISWRSGNPRLGQRRSLDLATLLPMFRRPDTVWVDLQYGDTSDERAALLRDHGVSLIKVEEIDNWHDLDGLAALISACDLVVTIDNSTAHFAAALARPTWIMLPFVSDWRWFTDREDSPWYASARLFRQTGPDDWRSVVGAIEREIGKLAEAAGV